VRIETRLDGGGPEPSTRRNPGILYGLGNLLDNALGFAAKTVVVEATWDAGFVTVRIKDDGKGFPPDILARVGEPYVTTRGGADPEDAEEGTGLGLGLFIAKSLLERSGATLTATNAMDGGAVLTVTWPRELFDVAGARDGQGTERGIEKGAEKEPLAGSSARRHITESAAPAQEVQGHATDSKLP
jgi:two-component system sensor histidine kinase RegB